VDSSYILKLGEAPLERKMSKDPAKARLEAAVARAKVAEAKMLRKGRDEPREAPPEADPSVGYATSRIIQQRKKK
jgi:hypothetical protein